MADKLRIVNRAFQRIGARRLTSLTENTRERLSIDAAYDDVVSQELMTNFWTFAIIRTSITADAVLRARTATIATAGTGYSVGDTLTLSGGTAGTATTLRVDAVTGGVPTAVSLTGVDGDYTVAPTSPVSTTTDGGGSGCTLTMTFGTGPEFGRSNQFKVPSDYLRSAPKDPKEAHFYSGLLFEQDCILSEDAGPLELRYVSDLSVLGNLQNTITNKEDLFHPLFANAVSMRLAAEVAEELVGSSAKLDRVEAAYTFFVNSARKVNAIEAGPTEPDIDDFVAVRISSGVDPSLRKYS